jgi:hypothetical protein
MQTQKNSNDIINLKKEIEILKLYIFTLQEKYDDLKEIINPLVKTEKWKFNPKKKGINIKLINEDRTAVCISNKLWTSCLGDIIFYEGIYKFTIKVDESIIKTQK